MLRESVCRAHTRLNVPQIKGKVNALSVDSCQRLGILFDDLVSSCELVNSTRIQVQVTGVVPIIAIDKCDGVQVKGTLQVPDKPILTGCSIVDINRETRGCSG